MDDLLAISMDPRVGMVQGDQPLEKKKASPNAFNAVKIEIILIRHRLIKTLISFFNLIHINKYL